jgi:excisionase family DNA binding protein
MPLSTRIDTASSASSPTHALLSREEAARYLGISTATLRRMVKARTISSVKIGHRRLFELEALRAFVASKRQDAVA